MNTEEQRNQMDKLQKLQVEQRSEEVNHIVEHMPTRFGWYVIGIIVLLVVFMLIFGWLIRYPEILQGQISISAHQADIKINSNVTGKLELFGFRNGDNVKFGDFIGMIKNGAELQDIEKLDSLLDCTNISQVTFNKHRKLLPENLVMGELNSKYFAFLNALYQYLDYQTEQPYRKQREIGKVLLTTHKQLESQILRDYRNLKQKAETTRSITKRDSFLLVNKIISKADYEKSLLALFSSEQEFEAVNKEIINNKYQINEATSKLKQIDIEKMEKERDLQISLFNSYNDLKLGIKEWERKYLFVVPIDGKLDFMNFLKSEDFIQAGQDLFTIVPKEKETIGQMFLPEQGAGKVKEGMDVIVKLNNYPYIEFGSIKGTVKSISLVTNQQVLPVSSGSGTSQMKVNTYLVQVSFPFGLKTNYGSELMFRFEAKGTAEIITNDRRLLQRLFDNLKYRLKRY